MDKRFFSFSNSVNQSEQESSQFSLWSAPRFRVKFMHRGLQRGHSTIGLLRQFPKMFPQWGHCYFDFDHDCKEYDWLVVYHDLPPEQKLLTEETLVCPKEKTILITGEPSTITVFGSDYLKQFGWVLTFQEPWAIKHPNAIFHHPGLIWYYGLPFDEGDFITWDQMKASGPPKKERMISTVCSQRKGNTTLHSRRVAFCSRLKNDIADLDIFGHGVRAINDKAEALNPYSFHIAIENHVYAHHITEKLPDAFLGYCVPFYHGAPNASDYFPKESYIPIDINDYKRACDIIQSHLANNEYLDRLPYVIESRRRILEEQNLFAILDRIITNQDKTIQTFTSGKTIRDRKTLRIKNPLAGIRSLWQKVGTKLYHNFN